ncbi:MAG: ATP cone domain-containing protein [Planctomycetota bacterium]
MSTARPGVPLSGGAGRGGQGMVENGEGRDGDYGAPVRRPAAAGRAARRVRRVQKRDGREVPFDAGKIRAAVSAALAAVGASDPDFAAEVAGVVELALHEEAAGDAECAVPHIEHIQDLVEKALMELGAPEAAKAYILYRDRRARIREALQVHAGEVPRQGSMRVREMEGVSPWSKGRIVAGLMEEAELPRPAAEEVAAAVEARVFSSGLRRITTSLVRELVLSELFERGWTRALRRQGLVGLARPALRGVLAGHPLAPWREAPEAGAMGPAVRDLVAGEILARYALEDVLPEDAAELHRLGDLSVEGLESPHLPLSLSVEAELLAAGGDPLTDAFALLDEVARRARGVSRVLVLEEPGTALAPLLRATRRGSPLGLAAWLGGLKAVARGAGVAIDLACRGARFPSFTSRLVEELGELPADPFAPRLFLEGHELEEVLGGRPDLAGVLDRLLAEGSLIPTWGEEEERFAGPGCHRRHRERGALACGGAVALNLPRLARRAGSWREEIVQVGLAELVQASLALARSLESFQRAPFGQALAGLRARVSYAIVPVGLREALFALGDGAIDADQGARLLGLLAEAARRFSLGGAATVSPCPFFGEGAAARFAWIDGRAARAAGARQGLLFGAAEAGEAPRPYSTGFALSPAAERALPRAAGRAEAEVLKTLPVGALSFAGLPLSPGVEEPHPHLAAWRRFEVRRRAQAGELSLELFPVPPPAGAPALASTPRPLV